MDFPKRLAALRKERGLTQQALADMAGVHFKHIVVIRNHKVLLDTDLAELYGMPTKVLGSLPCRFHVPD